MREKSAPAPVAAPEWVTARRLDRKIDERVSGGWQTTVAPIHRGSNYTDFGTHEMSVPAGDTESAKAVRAHELLHAQFSPTSVPVELLSQMGTTQQSVRTAEEVRINLLGLTAKNREGESILSSLPHLADGSEVAVAKKAVENKDWQLALSMYLNTYNTDINAKVKRHLSAIPQWKTGLQVIDKKLRREGYSVKSASRYKTSFRSLSSTYSYKYEWKTDKGQNEKALLPSGFVEHTLPLAHLIDEWKGHPPTAEQKFEKGLMKGGLNRYGHSEKKVEWETLRFGMTALTETASAFIGKRKRPSMTGKFPVRPDRLLTDPERRIFRETVKSHGGIVVVDCSGSMSLSHSQVLDILHHYSGATIVAYTHTNKHSPNAWILAKNGKMISQHNFSQINLRHGNGVDLPILQWAVRQRKNRKEFLMWISDGGVTGKGDNQTDSLIAQVCAFIVKHDIIGVESTEGAIELLREMKLRGRFPRQRHARYLQNFIDHYLPQEETNEGTEQ
jgi:hypothetical protein